MALQPVPVFVVSLARVPERRASVTAHLRALGVAFDIVDAIDGELIPAEQRRALQAEGTNYHAGVLGCYLSHTAVYRLMLASDIRVALALEDDARLNPAFVPALKQGLHSLDFDYCFLDCQNHNEDGPIYYNRADGIEISPGFIAYATHAGPGTTHAYLITRNAAARRLEHELPIRKPIDIYSSLPYRPSFRALVSPRGAGLGEDSLRSFTSARDHSGQLSLRTLRWLPGYYALRDAISPTRWQLRSRIPELVRQGVLSRDGQWRPLPRGRPILL